MKQRTLWIDALCINQKDNHEKSQQVRMMYQLYKQASRVVIWLGAEDAHIPAAFSLIGRAFHDGARDLRPNDELDAIGATH